MSLSNSLNSMPTTRLMKMNGLPSTEDLRYMLTIAKEQKKMVELPFKHTNGFSFSVRVVPPVNQFGPKWTFGKDDGSAAFWTRESIDVMMIQNKVKIDSISSLNAGVEAQPDSSAIVFRPTVTGNNLPTFTDPLQNPFNNPAAIQPPEGFGNFGKQSLSAHGWMPEAKEKKKEDSLPAPVALDPESILLTLERLQNPETGLTDFCAFTYFLQREFSNHKKNGAKLALLIFDFRDKDTHEIIDLPVEAIEIVCTHLQQKCSPFDISSRMMESGEFVILLTGYGAQEAMTFAEGLWNEMTQDFMATFGEDPKSMVVGVSSIPEQCADPGVLISTARNAKEQARLTSRSHLLFASF